MPLATKINFPIQAYQNRSLPVSAERLVNMYAEKTTPTSKSNIVIHNTPGQKLFSEIGNEPIYGMHPFGVYLYIVTSNSVYIVDNQGGSLNLGTIGTVTNNLQIDDNGAEVIITNNDNGATFIATPTSLTAITDADFRNPSSLTTQDGYAIYSERDSDIWFISGIRDASIYDSLDFTRAEEDSDELVRMFSFNDELWAMGQRSIQKYRNTGALDFPFQSVQGATLEYGCGARLSVASLKNRIIWLDNNGNVQLSTGGAPTKVSSFAIDEKIRKLGSIDRAVAFIYSQEGHDFYVLTFPNEFTVVYDFVTGLWHDRKTYNETDWKINCGAFFANKVIVGSSTTGKLYELDLDYYTDNGGIIERIMQTPPLFNNSNRIFLDELFLDIEQGVGLTSGQGSEPLVFLQKSDDGGHTFSGSIQKSLGKKGEYKQKVSWRRLGKATNMTYRFVITDPIKVSVSGIYAKVRGGI